MIIRQSGPREQVGSYLSVAKNADFKLATDITLPSWPSNEAVHAWWLPTGEARDPYMVLDMSGRKSRARIREDVIPGVGDPAEVDG